jgi:hypothetical protein
MQIFLTGLEYSSRAILPSTLGVDMREEEIGKC